MKINLINNTNFAFRGTTAIRAVTDSHQEARKECKLLSKIANDVAEGKNNILLLNAGDLLGGVYARDVMVDSYIKFKKSYPDVEIVMTIGNNDAMSVKDKYATPKESVSDKNSIEFLKEALQKFNDNGIHVVCANLIDKETGDYPSWIKPYKVVERDNDRIFVTGFCIDRLPDSLGVNTIDQVKAFERLKTHISKEKPDSIIVLNHDYDNTSQKLVRFAKEQGINIDLLIGGHDHDNPETDVLNRIYCPKAFSKSMFEMDLEIKDKVSSILNSREVFSDDLPINDEFEQILKPYEDGSGILDIIAPHTLNLPKFYAHPGSLGTFIADGMKKMSKTDVAFFASNIVRVPLYYQANADITNYDLRKIIAFDSTVQKANLSPDELKEVLTSAVKDRLKLGEQNAKFLQCSNNVKIVGRGNSGDKSYKIEQIYINDEPLFESDGRAINPDRKISCAFDNYIPTDGRSQALQNAKKEDVVCDNKTLRTDEVLKSALQDAVGKYEAGTTYPKFVLEEIIG